MAKLLGASVIVILIFILTGCGGGGSSSSSASQQAPPPPANFSISLSPSSVAMAQGGNASVNVSVIPQNGFSGNVSVNVQGLPTGVTVAPSNLSVTASSAGTLTFTASGNAQVSQNTGTVQAVSGALQASAGLPLTVSGAAKPVRYHSIGGSLGHGYYDEKRGLLFVTNLGLNEVDVVSAIDFSVVARVSAPQPWGIDQMGDGKTLVIGTLAQQIVTVDEDTLALTLHPVPNGFSAFGLFYPNVVAMANGKVFIIGQEEGISSNNITEGGQYLLEWDSIADSFRQIEPTDQLGWEVDSLIRSADHKWMVFSADQFYLYSSDADTLTPVPLSTVNPPQTGQNDSNVRGYAINADGSKIAVANAYKVTVLDRSLNVLGTVQIPTAFQSSRTAVMFSHDGSKLIVQYPIPTALEMLDLNSYTALGFYSGAVSPEDNGDVLIAVDAAGRALVAAPSGVVTVDTTGTPVPNSTDPAPMPRAYCPSLLQFAAPLNTSTQLPVYGTRSLRASASTWEASRRRSSPVGPRWPFRPRRFPGQLIWNA